MGIGQRTAHQSIDFLLAQQHRGDQGATTPHLDLGVLLRHAFALHEIEVRHPIFPEAGIVVGVDDIDLLEQLRVQAQLLDAMPDHFRTPDQHRTCDLLIDENLCGLQDPSVLAFCERNTLARRFDAPRDHEQRLHQGFALVDELLQTMAIGLKVDDRNFRDT